MGKVRATRREWLTPPEIGALIGSRPETVVDWIKQGELPASNFARRGAVRPRFRVHVTALDEFVKRRSVTPPPARQRRRSEPTDIPFVR